MQLKFEVDLQPIFNYDSPKMYKFAIVIGVFSASNKLNFDEALQKIYRIRHFSTFLLLQRNLAH